MDWLEKAVAKYFRNKSKALKFSKSLRISRLFFGRKNCCGTRANKYERIISREINAINYAKGIEAERRYNNGEDVLPHCDLTVWLRNCEEDISKPITGDSMGTIPTWLQGNLLRNGPGTLTIGEDYFNHLFDAPAVLHRFCIEKRTVTYQCKFLKSETYKKNMSAQRIVVDEFGTKAVADPCKTIFQKFTAIFSEEMSDNCMISLYPFGDQIFAMGETPVMYKIDPNNIDTIGKVNISEYVNIIHNSSHPHVENDGTVYMLGLSIDTTGPKYSILKFPNATQGENTTAFSETQIVAKIGTRWPLHPGYMHSFGLTPNYYVIVEQPLSVSLPAKIASAFTDRPLSDTLKWYPDYPTIFHVVSRLNNKVVLKYEAEPFFYLHLINQYEEENHVVVDICAYKDPKMIDCMLVESLKGAHENPKYANFFRSRPVRFVLPLRTHGHSSENLVTLGGTEAAAYRTSFGSVRVIPEMLCNMGCETPRINYPNRLGKKYRYFYSISADVDLENPGTLIKVDTYTRTHKTWNEPGTFPCEPIFVPSPDAQSEDDGVVLTSLLWAADERKVALVILDAKSFTEIARTEFYSPTPVPKCLHGWFSAS